MSYPYEPYKWWVNNILPVVYDDSLSYYEVLSKLRYYVDGLIGDVKRLTEIVNTIEGIEDIEQFTEMLNQIKDEIGDLENLQTADKDDIVSAINEVVYDLGMVKLAIDKKYTKPPTGIPESDLSDELKEKINEQFEQDKNYNNLSNKPKINHIEIEGDHEPGYYGIGTYNLPENGIPESDLAEGVKDKLNASSENTEKIDGIASSVTGNTADREYEVGELVFIDGKLYKITKKVYANTSFVPGNNVELTTINGEFVNIDEEINKLKIAVGAESYDMDSGVITTSDKQVYTLFFRYFKAIAGEDYLFIVIPASSNVTNSGYNINIYNEGGEVVYTFNSGNNVEDYKNERRFTFTPGATGNYYCGIKKDENGTGYPVVQTIMLKYTEGQATESLVQMVSELLPLRDDVESLETFAENQGERTTTLESATGVLRDKMNATADCVNSGELINNAVGEATQGTMVVTQKGNVITVTGANTATANQGGINVNATEPIVRWASAKPDVAKVYPIKTIAGHKYKVKLEKVSGSITPGGGSGNMRLFVSHEGTNEAVTIANDAQSGEIEFISDGKSISIWVMYGRLSEFNVILKLSIVDESSDGNDFSEQIDGVVNNMNFGSIMDVCNGDIANDELHITKIGSLVNLVGKSNATSTYAGTSIAVTGNLIAWDTATPVEARVFTVQTLRDHVYKATIAKVSGSITPDSGTGNTKLSVYSESTTMGSVVLANGEDEANFTFTGNGEKIRVTIMASRLSIYNATFAVFVNDITYDSWWLGKRINWLGDSIVAGDDFDEIVSSRLGAIETDYGINGSTIALASNGTNPRSACCVRYADMSDDCDVVAVSCGSNDWMYALCPIGTIEAADDGGENNTFYGALKALCNGLIKKYPDKKIFFTTPIKRAQAFENGNGGTYTSDGVMTTPFSKNKYGKTLMDYADIIIEVCGYYSIPVLDMNRECLLNPSISEQQGMFDNIHTHPNNIGRSIMADRLTGWLTNLFR